MVSYDKEKIGKLVAWRGDHFVFEYGTDQEIKFSKLDYLMGYKNAKKKNVKDYETCKKFFSNYLLETEIVNAPNGKRIALLQPKVIGHFLIIKDLQQAFIRQQFKEVLQGYYAMIKAGEGKIDLIGQKGAFSRCMSNIFVTKDNMLTIFDATLIDVKSFSFLKDLSSFYYSAWVCGVKIPILEHLKKNWLISD